MPDQSYSLLYLHALTSLHPGCGTGLGVVDLPVQRERHTQWPLIPGSSLKGVFRDACRRKAGSDTDADLVAAFGPSATEGRNEGQQAHAGALSFTDARVLAFPVRSLKGVFAWVTCPAVLERYLRDLTLAGKQRNGFQVPSLAANAVLAEGGLQAGNKTVVLEEFPFEVKGGSAALAECISVAVCDSDARNRFQKQLAVVTDDYFTYFVRRATEVVARIGLNYQTKVVKDGALFYQEFLPPETLFYALVISSSSRTASKRSAGELSEYLQQQLPPYMQIGGDETTGKGICAVKLE